MKSAFPLNPLRTFEVAARLQNFAMAARELNVTNVAISRQIKVLEDYVGAPLFMRLHRGVELTLEGEALYGGLSGAFQDIAEASQRISRRGRRDILSIQSYTTVSQHWLIPRLTEFYRMFPKTEVRLSASMRPVDFEIDNLDAAIKVGTDNWPDMHSEYLVSIDLVPVCSPEYQQRHRIFAPRDIERAMLLHSMARLEDWPAWQAYVGAKFDSEKGLRFENSALAYEAAIKGAGIALAVKDFVAPSLREGRLVALFDEAFVTGKAYYLIWPKNAAASLPLKRFVTWVRGGGLSQGDALPANEP